MFAQTDIDLQLDELNANGVDLTLAELMRYRSLATGLNLLPKRKAAHIQSGAERSLFKGRGMEFDEARIYQAGDDIRNIDWRVTARTGKPHTKIFREERERPVFVYTDLSHSMRFGTQLLFKSVQASHLTALLGFAALSRGDKFGAVIFNQQQDVEIKPSTRQSSVLTVFDQLLSLHVQRTSTNENRNSALQALQRLHFIAKPGALIHLVSDFSQFTKAHFEILGMMSRHNEIIASQVFDAFEKNLNSASNTGQMNVTDGFNYQTIDFFNRDTLSSYNKKAHDQQEYLTEKFTEIGIKLRLISAGTPITEQLTLSRDGYVIGLHS